VNSTGTYELEGQSEQDPMHSVVAKIHNLRVYQA